MATKARRAPSPINLTDAVATVSTRYARARSAVVRIGVVMSKVGNLYRVSFSPDMPAPNTNVDYVDAFYLAQSTPVAGDVVVVLNDRDKWILLGVLGK